MAAANGDCEEEVVLPPSRIILSLSRIMDPSCPIAKPEDVD